MILQQSVQAKLLKKYDTDFNFYCAKSVNEVVYNETLLNTTIEYKDVAILAEANEYLKRIYRMKNAAGRNQIYERISMLADFYNNAVLLRYEHPIMIVSNTKNIFIKRLRRMKKMIASDCSSDQSSEPKSQQSQSLTSFSSSGFLDTIKTKDLSSKKEKSSIQYAQKSFESSVYDIWASSELDQLQRRLEFGSNSGQKQKTPKSSEKDTVEQSIDHLIIDIDDVNKQQAEQKYRKVQEKQNKKQQFPSDEYMEKNKTKKNDKKSAIIITPINMEHNQDLIDQSFSKDEKFHPRKSFLKSKIPKKTEYREFYDQTIRYGDRHPRGQKYITSYEPNIKNHASSPYMKRLQLQKQTERHYNKYQNNYDDTYYSPRNNRHYRADFDREMDQEQSQVSYNLMERQSRRIRRKMDIRQKAIALLHNVRNQHDQFHTNLDRNKYY